MSFTPAIYNTGMSRIDIQHVHALSPGAARQAVEDAIVKLGHKVGLDYRWEGDTVHFVRPGVEGRIELLPGQVHVTAKLGLLFSAMRGTIETELLWLLKERL
jgi:putative polyhydroxyalkanoate system protein